MIKIGFFTDAHLRGQPFSSRVDDYSQAIVDKLSFCLDYCANNCDIVVFGGDMTDSHRLASDSLKEKIIVVFNEKLPQDQPFFFTYGQHDLYGRDYESRNESTTAWLMRFAVRLGKQVYELPVNDFLSVDVGNSTLSLTACPSGFDPVEWSQKMSNIGADGFRVAVVHHLLTNEKADWFIPFDDFTTCNDKKQRGIDLVLCGDLHDGFNTYTNEFKTTFVNPGSLARTKKTKKSVIREIKGATIEVDEKTHDSNVTMWNVECAKSAGHVFRESYPTVDEFTEDEVEAVYDKRVSFNEVVERLSSIGHRRFDFWDLLEKRAHEKNIENNVLDYIMTKRPRA